MAESAPEMRRHPLAIRLEPSEKTESPGGLKHRHAAPAKCPAPALSRGTEEIGFQRKVNEVGNPHIRTQKPRLNRNAGVTCHTGWRGVNEAADRLDHISGIGDGVDAGGAEMGGKSARLTDRAATTARAYEQHGLERRIRHATAEAFAKAGPVGVVADSLPVPENDGVDRADNLGIRGQLIHEGYHGLLARVSDIDTGKTHQFRSVEKCRKTAGGQAFALQIH